MLASYSVKKAADDARLAEAARVRLGTGMTYYSGFMVAVASWQYRESCGWFERGDVESDGVVVVAGGCIQVYLSRRPGAFEVEVQKSAT